MSPQTRARLGTLLRIAGYLTIPTALGFVAGFYAADQGVRWMPTALGWLFGATIVASIAIPMGRFLQGSATQETGTGPKVRKRIQFALWIAALATGLQLTLHGAKGPSPLTDLDPAAYEQVFAEDSDRYAELDAGLERAVQFLEGPGNFFGKDAVLSYDEERTLLEAWTTIFDFAFALDRIRHFHEDWFRFDPSRTQRSYHLRSFLLSFAAELSLYEKSSRLATLIPGNPSAVKFLDGAHADSGLPSESFTHMRKELQGLRDGARYRGGAGYLFWLEKGLHAKAETAALGCSWLWERVETHLSSIEKLSGMDLFAATVSSDLQWVRQGLRRIWFPAQTSIAEWMGDTKLRRVGQYLISSEQQREAAFKLEPGDILLSRKNWYLSNVGLPGFWPHGILYIGTPEQLESYFSQEPDAKRLIESIARRDEASWNKYLAVDHGDSFRVIEAISEGVVLNTMAHACGDYLVALRPRLPKLAKAQAIVQAFSYLGRPYDFDFDFATDDTLVCTELVWRSYRSAQDKAGLEIPLIELLGRKTLPANEIARLFAAEWGKPDAQLDFVFFLDASEEKKMAFFTEEESFVNSCKRTKWSSSDR